MKNLFVRSVALLLVAISLCLMLSGCVLKFDEDKYMTRDEVEDLIGESMIGNVTVEGGDNFNINIEGGDNPNVIAAAKGLLSAVSVSCHFEYKSGYGSSYTGTTTETQKGAGVIYRLDKETGDAYIITNFHVVYDPASNTVGHISKSIYAELYGMEDCGKEIACEYVGGSMYYDLAVLKVNGSRILAESNAVAVTPTKSPDVSVLDTAIAIGNPEGEGISATVGYVNVDSEYIDLRAADGKTNITIRVMRIDTAVNQGNSGGGLFNEKGEIIGIVSAKTSASSVENIGYAIPFSLVQGVVENVLYHCDGTEFDCVRRAMVGVNVGTLERYTEVDTETGKVYKREVVAITGVTVGGVAEGRLLIGDVVNSVTIDGVTYVCDRAYKLPECMLHARVGSTVVFDVVREGVSMQVTLPITEATLTDW